MKLPTIVTTRSKYVVLIVAAAIIASLYMLTNQYHLIEPQTLPMTNFEAKLQFMPTTIWIYLSMYPWVGILYVLLKGDDRLNRVTWAFIAIQIFAFIFFMIYPTTYPRNEEILTLSLSENAFLTNGLIHWLWSTDTPANCLPSLHVANIYMMTLGLLYRKGFKQKTFWVAFIYSTIIAISTLTTKQHYIWDVLSGFGLALCSYLIFTNKRIFKSDLSI